jgi:hypothetical protein
VTDNLNNFCLIAGKDEWEAYKDTVAASIGEEVTIVTPTKIEFPNGPERYPCLVATVIVRADPLSEGSLSSARVCGCFVYPKDAKTLLDACIETEVVADAFFKEEGEESKNSDLLLLVFALLRELESIGAIKREGLAQSMTFAETWLQFSNAENQDFSNLLKSFWKEIDNNAS